MTTNSTDRKTNTMESRARHFVTDLMNNSKNHEEWLTIVNFGLGTLLQNQPLLIECIGAEVARQVKIFPTHCPLKITAQIMRDLGLQLSLSR